MSQAFEVPRATTRSEALTEGIRISVTAQYLPSHSSPKDKHYFFAYRVRIVNEGQEPAQLISRHWVITDAAGRLEEVKGPGVVGEQPRLEPGQEHVYTSCCPLSTTSGSMRGTYQMVRDTPGGEFDAVVAPFPLFVPELLN